VETNHNKRISGIYAITPNHALNIDAMEKVIIQYNITLLQYRHKTLDAQTRLNEATQLQQLCLKHHTLFIIDSISEDVIKDVNHGHDDSINEDVIKG
jgi:thiamine-phosphate pyrophosphorylase